MKKGTFLSLLVIVLAAYYWTTVATGCANIIPPGGGPRDSIPPRLVRANPKDSTVNFNAKRINLEFDEYVDLKDVAGNVLFTPTFEVPPRIGVRARTVFIEFSEENPLDSNTTYVINFGSSLVDVNESNPLKNFEFAFSTGPALDSLELTGRVILAETGEVDSTLTMILHRDLRDSAVVKSRPPYVVKLDNNGYFHFRYLPKDTFAVYALDGSETMRRYLDKSKLFAFYDRPVISGETDSLILYAYRDSTPVAESPTTASGNPVAGPRGNVISGDRRLRLNTPPGAQDLKEDYVMSFPVPVRTLDTTQIRLTRDTTFTPVPFSARLDSTGKLLTIRSPWVENSKYNLELGQAFATDTSGRQLLKTDTLFFDTKKLSDYGNLNLRIRGADTSRNPVLLIVQNGTVVLSAPIRSGAFSQKLMEPGEYDLRILYDTNGNGKWDPGRFFTGQKLQPELVVPITQSISIKANYENEAERVVR